MSFNSVGSAVRTAACTMLLLPGCNAPYADEIEALATGPAEARRDAVLALRRADEPLPEPAVTALIVATADPDPAVARGALDALADQPGPAADSAVLAAVGDARDGVAFTAAMTAARRGIADEPSIKLLADKAASGEIAAIVALGQAGPAAAPALPALVPIVTRSDVALARTQAAVAIGKIGPDEKTRKALERVAARGPTGTLAAAIIEALATKE